MSFWGLFVNGVFFITETQRHTPRPPRRGGGHAPRSPTARPSGGFGVRPAFSDVTPLARLIVDEYLAGRVGRVDIIHSVFISTLAQRPQLDRPGGRRPPA